MVQLEEPYQRGWKRSFILREDVARCHAAEFYAILLAKINTETYSTNKGFTHKKRRRGKKVHEVRPQQLADFYTWEWNHPKCKLTDAERTHFYQKECWCKRANMMVRKWVFAEPWRYMLQVKPRMITHVKMLDKALEREMQQLENRIEINKLRPTINRLVYGKSYNRWRGVENERQKNPLHHKPLYQILEAVSNDDL